MASTPKIMRFRRDTSKSTDLLLKKRGGKLFIFFFFIVTVSWSFGASAQTARPSLEPDIDAKTRQQIVDEVIRQLHSRYVLPGAVERLEAHLRGKLHAGGYDNATPAARLAQALTQDLRTVGDDLHLEVSYDPKREQALKAAGADKNAKLPDLALSAEERESLRKANYGFDAVKVMLGNVGYVDLASFVDLKYSRSTAIAAMGFIANADAVIIDLRRNHGGSGSLVNLLASYFFGPEPVELMSSYDRETDTTTRQKTLRKVPGKRLPNVDVYVLTSRDTGSAAEAFAFILQQTGRGKTVGDRTAGAAHGGGWVPLGQGFTMFVPTFRGFNPRTGKSWNSVGVQPDIPARADTSVEVAHFEAVKRLLAKATSDLQKQPLNWILPLLELKASGQKPVPPSLLSEYSGIYEGVTISLVDGQLYFLGASGVRRNLLSLAEGYFLVEDATVPAENQARVRFVRNVQGKIIELQLMVKDGRVFRRPRQ